MAEGEHRRWPVGADEPIVFMVDVTATGHSTSESTGSARSHRFILNNRECMTVPYQACQLSVCSLTRLVNLYDCHAAQGR
jgi:hypothetical protein